MRTLNFYVLICLTLFLTGFSIPRGFFSYCNYKMLSLIFFQCIPLNVSVGQMQIIAV